VVSGEPGPAKAVAPALTSASIPVLIGHLGHPNGWWRDTAQRLLVERGDRSSKTVAALARRFRDSQDARVRLHALFTLDGLGAVPPALVKQAAGDADRFVRAAGGALIERGTEAALMTFVRQLAAQPSLAEGGKKARPRVQERLHGHELDVLHRLLDEPSFAAAEAGRVNLLKTLASRVVAAGRPEQVLGVLDLVAAEPRAMAWRQIALLDGIAAAKSGERAVLPPAPSGRPVGWARLLRSQDPEVRTRATALAPWLGEELPKAKPPAAARALSAEEKARFERGKALYPGICGACHQPSGLGEEGKGPPLVESPWVLGTPERLVRIALHGLRGPVKVGDRTFVMDMPAMGGLPDAQLAELLTYVRGEQDWGHDAAPVDVATIDRIRKTTANRDAQWTMEELLKMP
jgi:mono/diheme cytochrome c family protein